MHRPLQNIALLPVLAVLHAGCGSQQDTPADPSASAGSSSSGASGSTSQGGAGGGHAGSSGAGGAAGHAGSGGSGGHAAASGHAGSGGMVGHGGAAGMKAGGAGGAPAGGSAGSAQAGAGGVSTAGSGGSGAAGAGAAGVAGASGGSGQPGGAGGGVAGGAGDAGSSGNAGAGGFAGAGGSGGSAGVVVPPLPPLPKGAGTGTTYYVSPGGNDGNDGKSEGSPWQTLAKVAAGSYQPGDSVLLEGGAPFTGCLVFNGGNVKSTPDAPFTLASYGQKPFQLTADCAGQHVAAVEFSGVDGFVLTDCVLRGNGGGAEYGVLVANTSGKVSHGARVQRCDISGFYAKGQSDYGAEIFVNGLPSGLDGVSLLNNTLHGASGPTSPDDNGVTGFGQGTNITHVLYQGNTVFDIGGKPGGSNGAEGNGLLVNGADGAVVQYNVVHGCGANSSTCGGPAGIWAYGANNVTIQYNEVYGMAPAGAPGGGCDWNAYDLDGSVTNSVVQYNYSHDNFGTGYLAYINGPWSGNVFRYNIGQNDGSGANLAGYQGMTSDLAIYNNTLFTSSPMASPFQIAMPGGGSIGGHVSNNILVSPGGAPVVNVLSWNTAQLTGLAFVKNDYSPPGAAHVVWGTSSYDSLMAWASATGQEMQGGALAALSADPLLQSPGSSGTPGGYDPAALSGYQLQASSTLRGAGLDLKAAFGIDPGPTDFFGHPIPHGNGSGYNVGADGAP